MTVVARLEALTRHGLPWSAYGVVGILLLAANYDISVIAFVLPSVSAEYGMATAGLALPVTLNLIGYAIGALIIGYLSDRFGRRTGIMVTSAVLAVSAILTALAWNSLSFSLFRGLCGIGTGATISLAVSYLSEMMPARQRGISLNTLSVCGGAVILGVGYALPPLIISLPHTGWRFAVGLAVFAGLAIPLGLTRRMCPESPRWLARRGRLEEAAGELAAYERRAWARGSARPAETAGIRLLPDADEPESSVRTLLKTLRDRTYSRRVIMITGYWLFLYFTDYMFLSYAPIVYEKLGHSTDSALWITAISRSTVILVPFLLLFVIERVERKWLTAAGTVLLIAGFGILLLTGTLAVAIGGIVATFGIYVIAGTGWIYTGEIFPSQSRATAAALGDGVGHVGGAIQPLAFIPLLAAVGVRWTLGVFILTGLIAAVIICLGPKNRGMALSEMDAS
ncbi:MAG: sugar porter family MFS transporter [Streptosporangiales bacterium]|nr:sugar porter family MFS transporter [Streptosporangiales bacterium]